MKYIKIYKSIIGELHLISDGEFLNELYLKKEDVDLGKFIEKDLLIFDEVTSWLDEYFSGNIPSFLPKIKLEKISSFQKEVYDELITTPYGKSITYGELASKIALKRGIKRMSSQAIGGALKRNPIILIIPCHRVLAKNSLGGFNLGLENKKILLKLEKII